MQWMRIFYPEVGAVEGEHFFADARVVVTANFLQHIVQSVGHHPKRLHHETHLRVLFVPLVGQSLLACNSVLHIYTYIIYVFAKFAFAFARLCFCGKF